MARPTLGPKVKAAYRADDGLDYEVEIHQYLKTAGNFPDSTVGLRGLPKRAKMRRIGWLDGSNGSRLTIHISQPDNVVYRFGGSLTIAGTAGEATGRSGEHFPL